MLKGNHAVLDLGTNTFHLLIFRVDPEGQWKPLLRRRKTVKIGRGGIHHQTIRPAAFKRGMKALQEFHNYIKEFNVKSIRAYGTAALRTAANGEEFIVTAGKKYKIPITLITGKQEAEFILAGVRQAVDTSAGPVLIVDIGGGSTELIIADNRSTFFKQSFPLGAALLLEQFNPGDPMKKSEVMKMKDHIIRLLEPLWEAIEKHQPQLMVGSAGSFESFASMIRFRFQLKGTHYGKRSYPILKSHLDVLISEIIRSDIESRKAMKGLVSMRVDMIVMAALLVQVLLKETGIKEVVLSGYSLKEGAAHCWVKESQSK